MTGNEADEQPAEREHGHRPPWAVPVFCVGIRGAGYGIRDTGCGIRGAGYGIRDTGCGIRGAGYGVRGAGYGVRDTGCGVRDTGYGVRGAGFGVRDTGCGIRSAGFGLRDSPFNRNPSGMHACLPIGLTHIPARITHIPHHVAVEHQCNGLCGELATWRRNASGEVAAVSQVALGDYCEISPAPPVLARRLHYC
ncbi:MAG: hypothetical protein WBF93_17515 [Pirellulales bacterium]